MKLSIFQRLVLVALGELIWICGGRERYAGLAEMLRTIACGHHNDAQQDAMFEHYKRSRGR